MTTEPIHIDFKTTHADPEPRAAALHALRPGDVVYLSATAFQSQDGLAFQSGLAALGLSMQVDVSRLSTCAPGWLVYAVTRKSGAPAVPTSAAPATVDTTVPLVVAPEDAQVDHKPCRACGADLPRLAKYFPRDRRAFDGLRAICRTCHSTAEADRRARRQAEALRDEATRLAVGPSIESVPLRTCPACHVSRPESRAYFVRDRRFTSGWHPNCKACFDAQQNAAEAEAHRRATEDGAALVARLAERLRPTGVDVLREVAAELPAVTVAELVSAIEGRATCLRPATQGARITIDGRAVGLVPRTA